MFGLPLQHPQNKFPPMRRPVFILLLVSLSLARAGFHSGSTTVPLANLSRSHYGATITANSSNPAPTAKNASDKNPEAGAVSMLICDDKTLSTRLEKGTSEFIIALSLTDILHEFSFFSYGVGGSLSVYTSPVRLPFNSPKWKQASAKVPFRAAARAYSPLNYTEAKYVKVVLNCRQPGDISGFSIFGTKTLRDFQVVTTSPNSPNASHSRSSHRSESHFPDYDFANSYNRTRIVYLSSLTSGDKALSAVDDDPSTFIRFNPADANPLIVLKMQAPTGIKRVSMVIKGPPASMEIYPYQTFPFDNMGYKEAELNPPTIVGINPPEKFFDKHHPHKSVRITNDGRGMSDFEIVSCQYLLIRVLREPKKTAWFQFRGIPLLYHIAAATDATDFSLGDNSTSNQDGYQIYEISAFGNNPNITFLPYDGMPENSDSNASFQNQTNFKAGIQPKIPTPIPDVLPTPSPTPITPPTPSPTLPPPPPPPPPVSF
jgi:hypothetical protein